VADLGHIDVLVNLAALTGGTLDLLDVTPVEMALAYAMNVTVPLVLKQQFARRVMPPCSKTAHSTASTTLATPPKARRPSA
jgi:NAD(P)-dependent dehydrogenase (short-subunit alcohol dehydrogenase family)